MAMNFDGGLTCALSVSDIDKAIAWYRDTLGFELLYKLDDMAWCEMKSPVDRVNVGLSEVEEAGGKGGATLTFGVTDIAAARADLESKGVKLDGDIQTIPDMVSLQTFYDPDGNALMLYQDLGSNG